jgi:hypothetical protein
MSYKGVEKLRLATCTQCVLGQYQLSNLPDSYKIHELTLALFLFFVKFALPHF